MESEERVKISFLLRAVAAAWLSLSGQGQARAEKAPAPAVALNEAAQEYSQYLQRESLPLRIRLGLSVDALPDVSFEKAERDAAFGRDVYRADVMRAAGEAGIGGSDKEQRRIANQRRLLAGDRRVISRHG